MLKILTKFRNGKMLHIKSQNNSMKKKIYIVKSLFSIYFLNKGFIIFLVYLNNNYF